MVDKKDIKQYWERHRTGPRNVEPTDRKEFFRQMLEDRCKTHPFLSDFASFNEYEDQRVLEIGVGPGTDFQRWTEAGAETIGVDISRLSIDLTKERIEVFDLEASNLGIVQADAERLPFDDESFDLVYSYGVLHLAPDTPSTFEEVNRVLKPGGEFKLMVYAVPSWVGLLLWFRYGLLRGKPQRSQKEVIYHYLESGGNKAYRNEEIIELVEDHGFEVFEQRRELGPGDLLLHEPSDKYDSIIYDIIWKLYPRWLIKRYGHALGTQNLIYATKSE